MKTVEEFLTEGKWPKPHLDHADTHHDNMHKQARIEAGVQHRERMSS